MSFLRAFTFFVAATLGLASPAVATGFESGAATTDIKLALQAFIKNATAVADAANKLGPKRHSPARVAANHLVNSSNKFRWKQLGVIFGKEALNAASTLAGLKGAQKTKAAIDVISLWANSANEKEFVKEFLRDKAAGKFGEKVKKLSNKDAEKLATDLFKKLTANATKIEPQEVSVDVTGTFDCNAGSGTMVAKVTFIPGDITVSLKGDCNCSISGQKVATYHATIVGTTITSANEKGETTFQFKGSGMRFGGSYCGSNGLAGRQQRPQTLGVLNKTAVANAPAQLKLKEICTIKDCIAIIDRMEENMSRVADLKNQLRYHVRLKTPNVDTEAFKDRIDRSQAQNEQLCRYFDECDCDKIADDKFINAKTSSGRTRREIYLDVRRQAGKHCR